MRKAVFLIMAGVIAAAAAWAARPWLIQVPATPAGRHVEAYIKAFNAGEAAMGEFFAAHADAGSLKQTPIDARLGRYRQMAGRLGKLELQKVLDAKPDLISALVRGANGFLVQMDFEFAPREPFGLLGIRVMDTGEGAAAADPKPDDAALVAAVQAHLEGLAARDEFSGAVLIAHNGKTLFEAAYGLADRDKKIPNRTSTKFNIGSINKSFTETAVRWLVAEGKLSLDDTIGKFLPDYPNKDAAAQVTVRHLLDMTSGIGDFFGERYQKSSKEKIRTLADYLPLFADEPLAFKPGERNRYSNGGFIVLGLIIAKASGMDYYDFVRERIYKPAGMTDSGSFAKDEAVSDRVLGYTKEDGLLKPNYDTLPGRGSSAGGGYSTLRDLLAYATALKEGRLGNNPGGGMGIAGGAPGLNAALEWDARNGYTIVVLANLDPPAAGDVALRIRSWLPRS
ncbi:MAG: serine hydrolase [Acidobacteriota bacterium]|nr:serine hydrolase [Acidobacteriota bacterium]